MPTRAETGTMQAAAKLEVPILLQFANADEHVARPRADLVIAAARDPKTVRFYDAGHELSEAATRDRARRGRRPRGGPCLPPDTRPFRSFTSSMAFMSLKRADRSFVSFVLKDLRQEFSEKWIHHPAVGIDRLVPTG